MVNIRPNMNCNGARQALLPLQVVKGFKGLLNKGNNFLCFIDVLSTLQAREPPTPGPCRNMTKKKQQKQGKMLQRPPTDQDLQ